MIYQIGDQYYRAASGRDRDIIAALAAIKPDKLPDPTLPPSGTGKDARRIRGIVHAANQLRSAGRVATAGGRRYLAFSGKLAGSREAGINDALAALRPGDHLPPNLQALEIFTLERGKSGAMVTAIREARGRRPKLGPVRLDKEGGPVPPREQVKPPREPIGTAKAAPTDEVKAEQPKAEPPAFGKKGSP